ncbi:hypothetical protein DFH09DRAFT_1121114 [Mycena vulgaris]|nr:hypothetical protein DFH09DRAFT_1121114 [Mycena vulgaris]
MSHQPRTISYALAVPALICNLIVIVSMSYLISDHFQSQIYTDGEGAIGPFIGLLLAALESLYLIIAIILAFKSVEVPPLAAILVDSLFLIPCYIAATIFLGLFVEFRSSGGECAWHRPTEEECLALWNTLEALQILAMVLQIIGLVLIFIDLVRVIRIRRATLRKRTDSL